MDPSESLPAIDVRGLVRSYRRGFFARAHVALHGLDLTLARGECVGLIGPNGSGKSTLLRVLAALDEPDSGQVRVFGADPDARAARRVTGFCPEDSPYPTELRARDVLALLGSLRSMERAACERRAAELLERVGLAHVARERLGGFSRGMLRRFCIAASLLHEPKLLLLDEPTAGLDAQGFAAIESLLDEARARGTTLLVSSHLLSDLHQRCERLVALVDGRIVAQGDAHTLAASLGSAARLELCFEGLDADSIAELRRVAQARGARLVGVQPAQSNLVELYRRGAAARRP
ncbi:MAG: ABC transporter ATP-binding protein [Planctomycetes bacterium]|nr:ABC transporter ATP-binding protein [Planctomycetota bacterium]